MKSVEVTRVMPRRCAASVAIVDFRFRRTADEEEQRLLELLKRAQPLETKKGRRGIILADDVGGELAQAVEVQRRRAALCKVSVGPMCNQIGALRVEARDDQRARHQAFEKGISSPSGSGVT